MRKPMGIAPAAVVERTLQKMMVVESGGTIQIQSPHEVKQQGGRLGVLLVVLPRAFEGGDFVVQSRYRNLQDVEDDEPQDSDDDEAEQVPVIARWQPTHRSAHYDLSLAAVYNHCQYTAEPVTTGTAVCLVYDLITPTPLDVPLLVGPSIVQDCVNEALAEYFNVLPLQVAKRAKLSADVAVTINEFGADRHFVYLIRREAPYDLDDDERKIARCLNAFCAQSNGQYVLYFGTVLFSHCDGVPVDNEGEVNATLRSLWFKYGEGNYELDLPPIHVNHHHDVDPGGLVKKLPLRFAPSEMDETDREVVEALYGNGKHIRVCYRDALVVQPTVIEAKQRASIPLDAMLSQLRRYLAQSRELALQYAQAVFRNRREFCFHGDLEECLPLFVNTVIEINDSSLFNESLSKLNLVILNRKRQVSAAIVHFGWDVCWDTLARRILSTPTWRRRVNLVVSAIPPSATPQQIEQAIDVLISLRPWTATKARHSVRDFGSMTCHAFGDLIQLAQTVSDEKVIQVVSILHTLEMVLVVAPALRKLVERSDIGARYREALKHVEKMC